MRRQETYAGAILKLSAGAVGVIAAVLIAHNAFDTSASKPPAPAQPPAGEIAEGGVTLTSQKIDLPEGADTYGPGPGSDLMNANCTACHSASMALNQPRLSKTDWAGEVQKMRETYKATVADKDVPAIVDYLTHVSDQLPRSGPPEAVKPGGQGDAAG